MTMEILKMIYFALVQSIIDYGITVYSNVNDATLQPLTISQNKLIRLIFKRSHDDHTAALYLTHNILLSDN